MGSLIGNLSRDTLRRVVRDIVIDELQTIRGTRFDPAEADADGDLDLDSLERVSVASRLSDFFALYESGLEDNLLRSRTLDGVMQVIGTSLEEFSQYVNVRSGGTANAPRTVRQDAAFLEQEVRVLAELFADRERVVLTIPTHHIYGFIFGALLPEQLRVPVLDARRSLLGGARRPRRGDLVVTVPFLWERLLPGISNWEEGIWGVSSTAPLEPGLSRRLAATPLERLVEIYGSSETGGIGLRDHWIREVEPMPFRLFPFWRRPETGEKPWVLERVPPAGVGGIEIEQSVPFGERTGMRFELPDQIEWIDDQHLIPRGRRDSVVQIGGHNVELEELSRRIVKLLPQVTDCALRIDTRSERLRAFLVVSEEPTEAGKRETRRTLRNYFQDHEIPTQITWGRELPRSAMGKHADW